MQDGYEVKHNMLGMDDETITRLKHETLEVLKLPTTGRILVVAELDDNKIATMNVGFSNSEVLQLIYLLMKSVDITDNLNEEGPSANDIN